MSSNPCLVGVKGAWMEGKLKLMDYLLEKELPLEVASWDTLHLEMPI